MAISLVMCSNTYRPLVVASLMAVVLVVLTSPFTRNATTAISSMQATPRVTTVSTSVKPTGAPFRAPPSFSCRRLLMKRLTGWRARR
jgi:hypothetical protein